MQIGTQKGDAPSDTPSSSPTSVGDRLKSWRRSRHETQESLAKTLVVDVGVLRKYENGVNAPGSLFLVRACAQGLNINWLLSGYGPMIKPDILSSMPPEVGARVLELAEVLAKLQKIDRTKFDVLVRGFTLRTVEAHRTAELEQEQEVKAKGTGKLFHERMPSTSDISISSQVPAPPQGKDGEPTTFTEGELSDIIVPGTLPQIEKK